MKARLVRVGIRAGVVVGAATILSVPVLATTYVSPSYVINGSIGATATGGASGSPSYVLQAGSGDRTTIGTTGTPATSMQVSVQPSGLLAYYPLDETSGTTAHDVSSHGYDATSQSAETWGSGQIGGAVGPMANDSSKIFISQEQDGFNAPTLTVCAWNYKTGSGLNPVLAARANGWMRTPGMWSIGYGNTIEPRFDVVGNGSTSSTRLNANTNTPYNTWNFLCGRYDGTTMALFVNGVLDAQTDLTGGTLPPVSSPLSIGGKSNGSNAGSNDTIDDVKLFGRVLSDAEIKTLYDAGVDGAPAGLTLGTLIAGAPQQVGFDTVVDTDGAAYGLSIAQDHNLQLGANTIPAIGNSIASPAAWTSGTTKGLGFTIVSAPGSPARWSGGANYAALPNSATTFYSRSGHTATSNDVVSMRLRADISGGQPIGAYKNTMTVTATATP